MTSSVTIVGAGECGARSALTLRELGFKGTVTIIGDEPTAPYERPPLSKATLGATTPLATVVRTHEQLAEAGIEFIAGTRAVSIDRTGQTVQCEDGREIPYDQLVMATGARARTLSLPGGHHARVLRTIDDTIALRRLLGPGRRLGVIGAGFIGLEVAATATALGCAVVVLEAAPRVLARGVSQSLADVVETRHRAAGVDIRCGVTITEIDRAGEETCVLLADGSTVHCDVLVAGVGAVPNTELADAAGLKIDDGIAVDACLLTDDPVIFAAGDCCSFPHPRFGGRRLRLEAWRNAIDQGAHVGRSIATGATEPFRAIPWLWSDQYELTLQVTGLADLATEEVERRRIDGAVVRFGLDGDDRLVSASGIGAGSAVAKDIRIAEMLIADGARPDRGVLVDPDANLRILLKART